MGAHASLCIFHASKQGYWRILIEYIHYVAHEVNIDSEVQVLALNTLNALKRSVKNLDLAYNPWREEIEAFLTGKKLTTIVFFLDETFEEITYDMAAHLFLCLLRTILDIRLHLLKLMKRVLEPITFHS
ncbi:hypothetical protein IFM89_033765 [Coptis chinensis]|uniref:Uncharacterized protein n=1 Tax=Coptis chinensis TaxID=261450 RepID=A0A835LPW1_9MAGN|nr:hypothetical protein IFM89_033765 [Coptis chinensis]